MVVEAGLSDAATVAMAWCMREPSDAKVEVGTDMAEVAAGAARKAPCWCKTGRRC